MSSLAENSVSIIRKISVKTKLNSRYPFCTAKTTQHCVKFKEIYCTNL